MSTYQGARIVRNKLCLLIAVVALLGVSKTPEMAAQTTISTPPLRDRLVFGTLAALPSELAFIDAVVEGVENGSVPARLVDSTFFWARRRTPQLNGEFARRPIIYFQPALEIQLARLGIGIATPRLSFFSRTF